MFLQSPEGTGRQSMGEHGQTGGSTTEEEILLQVTTHTHMGEITAFYVSSSELKLNVNSLMLAERVQIQALIV